jgi:DNA-binding MarR family transcriptional regulator
MTLEDPTDPGVWRDLRPLLAAMDDDIARLYEEAGIVGLKPTWVLELLKLYVMGPLTITQLATATGRTHSALSQKVAAMRAAGFVRTVPGSDARTRKVALTAKAKRIAGRLAAEWRATEEAVAQLDAELPYAMSRVVEDIMEALRRKSFHDRIAEHLSRDPQWH